MINKQKKSVQWKNSSAQYGKVAVVFHWLSAGIILGLFAMGLWMVELDYYDSFYTLAPWVHQSIGILFFYVMIGRFLWRLFNSTPLPVSTHNKWQIVLAKWVHRLFYVLIFVVLISGYLISTADNRAVEVFGWFTVPAMISMQYQEDIAGWIHLIVAYCLIGLVVLHVLGAIKHHFIDKDGSIKRIL